MKLQASESTGPGDNLPTSSLSTISPSTSAEPQTCIKRPLSASKNKGTDEMEVFEISKKAKYGDIPVSLHHG